jgi:predicted permease
MLHPAPQRSMPAPSMSSNQPPPNGSTRPHPWELVLHPIQTVRFMEALRRDPRFSLVRKLLYLAPLLILLVAVLLPEGIVATAVAVLVPLVGPLVNLPTDAAIDWVVLGLAAYALLGIFPAAVVREHHARLFHPPR